MCSSDLEQCLEYAASQECRVLATYVDYGISATIDGRQVAGWVDIRRRPVLNHAVGRANAPGIWLLLWHPDRLSAFAGCRAPIIKCLDGRVLRVGRGLVEPARFEMLEAPSSGLGMAS